MDEFVRDVTGRFEMWQLLAFMFAIAIFQIAGGPFREKWSKRLREHSEAQEAAAAANSRPQAKSVSARLLRSTLERRGDLAFAKVAILNNSPHDIRIFSVTICLQRQQGGAFVSDHYRSGDLGRFAPGQEDIIEASWLADDADRHKFPFIVKLGYVKAAKGRYPPSDDASICANEYFGELTGWQL